MRDEFTEDGDLNPTDKAGDYRRSAAAAVDLAHRAASTADKRRLLAMAEAWLDLADRARRLTVRHIRAAQEHPLIRAKFAKSFRFMD
jgi:hypothetical protein